MNAPDHAWQGDQHGTPSMLLGPVEGGLISQGLGLTAAFTVTGLLCLVPVVADGRSLLCG